MRRSVPSAGKASLRVGKKGDDGAEAEEGDEDKNERYKKVGKRGRDKKLDVEAVDESADKENSVVNIVGEEPKASPKKSKSKARRSRVTTKSKPNPKETAITTRRRSRETSAEAAPSSPPRTTTAQPSPGEVDNSVGQEGDNQREEEEGDDHEDEEERRPAKRVKSRASSRREPAQPIAGPAVEEITIDQPAISPVTKPAASRHRARSESAGDLVGDHPTMGDEEQEQEQGQEEWLKSLKFTKRPKTPAGKKEDEIQRCTMSPPTAMGSDATWEMSPTSHPSSSLSLSSPYTAPAPSSHFVDALRPNWDCPCCGYLGTDSRYFE